MLCLVLFADFNRHVGARIAYWQARRLSYLHTVEYVPGHKIPVADAIFCLPDPLCIALNIHSDDSDVIMLLNKAGNLTDDSA